MADQLSAATASARPPLVRGNTAPAFLRTTSSHDQQRIQQEVSFASHVDRNKLGTSQSRLVTLSHKNPLLLFFLSPSRFSNQALNAIATLQGTAKPKTQHGGSSPLLRRETPSPLIAQLIYGVCPLIHLLHHCQRALVLQVHVSRMHTSRFSK